MRKQTTIADLPVGAKFTIAPGNSHESDTETIFEKVEDDTCFVGRVFGCPSSTIVEDGVEPSFWATESAPSHWPVVPVD